MNEQRNEKIMDIFKNSFVQLINKNKTIKKKNKK